MKKTFLLFSGMVLAMIPVFSQKILTGRDADNIISGTQLLRYKKNNDVPDYIGFAPGHYKDLNSVTSWLPALLGLDESSEMKVVRTETDLLGFTHLVVKQYYKGIPLAHSDYRIHSKNGMVESVNGVAFRPGNVEVQPSVTPQQAITAALQNIGAETYKWELPLEEKNIKYVSGTVSATYYPQPELVIVSVNGDYKNPDLRLAYKMDVYAHQPMSRNWVYVDATTGQVILKRNRIHTADTPGTGVTVYSGSRTIVADYTGSLYRLRETGRGNGIQTYDMNTGTNYGSAVDFTDSDNNWNNVNAQLDQYASDGHWGAEMTYDYYNLVHSRNSIDGNGFQLRSYIHYDSGYDNAFWDGQRMTYGDGGSYFDSPLTSMDITGHEITHGLTENSANLDYQDESGALNESFSDIFGITIDNWSRGTTGSALWLIGEETTSGSGIRSMSNPNSFGDPDTYTGTNWYTGTADNGGVHTNSGVQNHWYYRLVQGGSGTNDLGNAFNVTGIGLASARQIAFRNLTVYLTSTSDYADSRFYSIQSAVDLFGNCSNEVIQTTNAWYAVGVGGPFQVGVTAQFDANLTTFCSTPATVNFSNLSTNANTYSWDFGDGNTSTGTNPAHTYTTPGTYAVQLFADGGTCGSDTTLVTAYITITDDVPNVNNQSICTAASLTLTASGSGTLNWYNNSTGGTSFNTGTSYTTPVLNTTTTYYVENVVSFASEYVGPATNSIGGGGYHNNTSTQYLTFDANDNITLVSAWVNAAASGSRTFDLRDANGNLIDSRTVNIASGQGRVTLNFDIPAGTGYTLGGTQMNLYRNNSGTNFPYNSPNGLATITGSSAGTGYYYYLYDWEVKKPDCVSSRVPVTVTFGSLNASFSEVQNGLQVTFTSNAAGATSYFWDFGDGNTSTQQNPVHNYPSNGTYNVMHIASASGCADTTWQSITVNEGNVGIEEMNEVMISVYPNPFAETVYIKINLPASGQLTADVQDLLGRKLGVIYNGHVQGGEYILNWQPGMETASGMYTINLTYNGKTWQHKLVHLK